MILESENRSNIPNLSIKPYSIVYASELIVTGSYSALMSLNEKVCIAIWEFCPIDKALFALTKKLKLSTKSYFSELNERRNFEFDFEKSENLLKLTNCGACASLVLYVEYLNHKIEKVNY